MKLTEQRLATAVTRLSEHDVEYALMNAKNGHLRVFRKSDGKPINYWAGTGRIEGNQDVSGINALLSLVEEVDD